MDFLRPWQRALAAIAMAKVVAACAIYAASFTILDAQWSARSVRFLAVIIVFALAAVLLMTAGRRDLRAAVLGIAYALIAAVFSDTALNIPGAREAGIVAPIEWLFAVQVDAFTGYFLWFFVQEFPRVVSFGPRRTVPRVGMRVAAWLGSILLALNFVAFLADPAGLPAPARSLLTMVSRKDGGSLYWPFQYALALGGLVALVWKAARAPVSDRRRVAVLIWGLIAGAVPTLVWTLLSTVSPAFRTNVPIRAAGWVLYPTLLSMPFTTAYAVLAHQALNVRLIVRRAIQYAMARYSLLGLAAIPALILVAQIYRRRDQPLSAIVGGPAGALVVGLVALSIVFMRARRDVMDRLDRRFFREQYDARRILADLVSRAAGATTPDDLAKVVCSEVDRALHPESVDVLLLDADRGLLESTTGRIRPLEASSPLVELMSSTAHVSVDLARAEALPSALRDDERTWLADADARLILPMKGTDRQVLGMLVIGEKRSELPYSSEDLLMLRGVSATAGIALTGIGHVARVEAGVTTRPARATRTWICVSCGLVMETDDTACERCGSGTSPCPLPRRIAGKFQIEERIAEGGMGVVYRGRDLSLGRPVAVKTLPRMSIERAVRLRREARAMAAISHRHLAMIFAAESWNGMPVLIVEYLPGETLAHRIRRGPLNTREVLGLGIALADVTQALHTAGIVHRDIKPGNIGFTADGTMKLLDFGLARLLSHAAGSRHGPTVEFEMRTSVGARDAEGARSRDSLSAEGQLLGTPLYLSPEAVAGETPDPSFDLWSISVLLFEALAGRNPLEATSVAATLHRIATGKISTLDEYVAQPPSALVEFFARALSPRLTDRPRSADALRRELIRLLDAQEAHRAA